MRPGRTASGCGISDLKIARLTSSFSVAASITMSASANAS